MVKNIMKKEIKIKKDKLVCGFPLPTDMEVIIKDNHIYFITCEKKDLVTLGLKLRQLRITSVKELYKE